MNESIDWGAAVLPTTMKAALLNGHGGLDQLEFRTDALVPHASAGEVLLKIGAAGLNNTDINLRTGWYAKDFDAAEHAKDAGWTGQALRFPRIQGVDACGRIVAVGAGVDSSRVGERVLVDPVIHPPAGGALRDARYFGSDCDGAFAEYAIVPAVNAHAISSALSDVELASFPCAYTAAENMLTRAAVNASDTVLISGASGGVGSAAIQLARRRGANVIAIVGAAKADGVIALGASRTVDRGANLVEVLGEESVGVVIDVVGGAQFPMLLAVLTRGGRYAVAGAIGGAKVDLDLRTLYLKDLQLFGCTIPGRDVFANLVGYIERGEIRPLVSATYPLANIAAAQADFLTKKHLGKIVLIP